MGWHGIPAFLCKSWDGKCTCQMLFTVKYLCGESLNISERLSVMIYCSLLEFLLMHHLSKLVILWLLRGQL